MLDDAALVKVQEAFKPAAAKYEMHEELRNKANLMS